ncbi:MAG: N-acetylmuramoyl-L-alanine amidase [Clostridia bacterium]
MQRQDVIRKCVDTLSMVITVFVVGFFAVKLISLSASVPEPALPAEQGSVIKVYTVILDAGHGGSDGGAVGRNGTVEAGLNLAVTKLVKAALEADNVKVIMTRSDDSALGKTKNADMAERKRILNTENVDAVISIHMNKFNDRSVKGSMAFFMEGSTEGEKLAQAVIDAVTDATGQGRRAANPGDYYVIRETPTPAVIIEGGFLSNSDEEAMLKDPDYQAKLASGIANGIMAYLEQLPT